MGNYWHLQNFLQSVLAFYIWGRYIYFWMSKILLSKVLWISPQPLKVHILYIDYLSELVHFKVQKYKSTKVKKIY
jgi:uncharacterized protein YqgC (DUF456 family)